MDCANAQHSSEWPDDDAYARQQLRQSVDISVRSKASPSPVPFAASCSSLYGLTSYSDGTVGCSSSMMKFSARSETVSITWRPDESTGQLLRSMVVDVEGMSPHRHIDEQQNAPRARHERLRRASNPIEDDLMTDDENDAHEIVGRSKGDETLQRMVTTSFERCATSPTPPRNVPHEDREDDSEFLFKTFKSLEPSPPHAGSDGAISIVDLNAPQRQQQQPHPQKRGGGLLSKLRLHSGGRDSPPPQAQFTDPHAVDDNLQSFSFAANSEAAHFATLDARMHRPRLQECELLSHTPPPRRISTCMMTLWSPSSHHSRTCSGEVPELPFDQEEGDEAASESSGPLQPD